jgi:hypothetical protein
MVRNLKHIGRRLYRFVDLSLLWRGHYSEKRIKSQTTNRLVIQEKELRAVTS